MSSVYIASDRKYIDPQAFQHGLKLTDECSRLIQSFVDKLKSGGRRGVQFKPVPKKDQLKEVLKEHAPEVYKRFYPEE